MPMLVVYQNRTGALYLLYMPDAAHEVVYTGSAASFSWHERGRKFIKDKIIDEHSPHAHEREFLKNVNWLTDHLDGKPKELALAIKPVVEKIAYPLGVAKTVGEITAVVATTVGVYLLAERALPRLKGGRESIGRTIRSLLQRTKS